MKKRFLSVILAISLCLGLAGCSSAKALEFNNNFYGAGTPTASYVEKLTYNVSLNATNKDSAITDELVKYSFSGTYVTELKVDSTAKLSDMTDLTKADNENLYLYTTALNVTATYVIGGGEPIVCEDYIKSSIYFLSGAQSYAPVKATTEAKYSAISLLESGVKILFTEYVSETNYKAASYTLTNNGKQYYDENTVTPFGKTNEHEYTAKSVIDNAQLYFALRNITLAKEASFTLPTVAMAYDGQATNLSVTNVNEYDLTGLNLTYNGGEAVTTVPVRELSFKVNETNKSGTPQKALIQNAAVGEAIPAYSIPVKYIQPLTSYGSITSLGDIEYTLVSAELTA